METAARKLSLVAFGLAAVVFAGEPASAASTEEIEEAVVDELRLRNLTSDIAAIEVISDHSGGGPRYHVAWVEFDGCAGHVVVKLSPIASVRDVYGVGDCSRRVTG